MISGKRKSKIIKTLSLQTNAPMFYAAITFAVGIIAQREGWIMIPLALVIAFAVGRVFWKTTLCFMVLGYAAAFLSQNHPTIPYQVKTDMIVRISDVPQNKGRWQRTTAEIISFKDTCSTKGWLEAPASRISLYADTANKFKIGDIIRFSAKQLRFDSVYYDYYMNKGITGRCFVYRSSFIKSEITLLDRVKDYSNKLSHRIAEITPDTQSIALMQALTLGDKSMLTTDMRSVYNRAGAAHLLAVSGLHVGIIFALLNLLLMWLKLFRRGYIIYGSLVVVCLWLYAAITGFSPSVLRAVLMFSIYQIGMMTMRQTNNMNTLACAAFILLVVEPNYLYDIGFQLSFVAMAGIAIFYKPICELWKSWVWRIVALSLAAQITVMPLACYYFGTLPLFGVVINLALWIVVPTIIVTVLIYLLTGWSFIADCAAWVAMVQNEFVSWCGSHSWIALDGLRLPLWGLIVIYLIMIVPILLFKKLRFI